MFNKYVYMCVLNKLKIDGNYSKIKIVITDLWITFDYVRIGS